MALDAKILIIDDMIEDATLTTAALREIGFSGSIEHVEDGFIGIGKIRNDEQTANAYDIAILDVNMGKIKGCSVLARLREDEKLDNLFIAILTTACCGQRGTAKGAGCTNNPANIYLEKKMIFMPLSLR
jgi:CheY-like chemotaxis protein